MNIKRYLKYASQILLAITFSFAHAGAYEDFFKAVELDDPRTITQLLRRGFDVNSPSESGQHALFLALRAGSHRAAGALMESPELKVDHANQANETALMMAALRGQLEWCRRLVERGAAINREGWTPLHYAATGPNPQAVTYLLERGALVDALSPNGTTPLMMASRYGDEGSVAILLAAKADPRLRNQKDLGPADFAKDAGREALASRLADLARK